jgi:hypothetical protein
MAKVGHEHMNAKHQQRILVRSFTVGTSKFLVVAAFIAGSAAGRATRLTYSQESIVPLAVEELDAGFNVHFEPLR